MITLKKTIAALFDLDGVVIDTESQYTGFWENICSHYGLDDNFSRQLKGQTLYTILTKYFSQNATVQKEITDALNAFESSMRMEFIPGVQQFIQDLHEHDIKLAIVTSSNKLKMELVYRNHPEFPGMFDRILTAEEFTRSKPDPYCYLLGAKLLGTDPENCFVFEDSFSGLQAGKKAGMRVIGLSTTNSADSIREFTDRIIPDFTGMTCEKLLST